MTTFNQLPVNVTIPEEFASEFKRNGFLYHSSDFPNNIVRVHVSGAINSLDTPSHILCFYYEDIGENEHGTPMHELRDLGYLTQEMADRLQFQAPEKKTSIFLEIRPNSTSQ